MNGQHSTTLAPTASEPRPSAPRRLGRRPGAASTRQELLDAARELFADVGYDKAGVRAIARRAGVDPGLVYHFFGSKEGLLRAALHLPIDTDEVFAVIDEHPGDEGAALVGRILEIWRRPQVREHLTAMLRAGVSHEDARRALRTVLSEQLQRQLEKRVGPADAGLRAALVASQIAGLALARFVIGIEPIAGAADDELVAAIGPTIQRYLTGDITAGVPES